MNGFHAEGVEEVARGKRAPMYRGERHPWIGSEENFPALKGRHNSLYDNEMPTAIELPLTTHTRLFSIETAYFVMLISHAT